MKYLNVAEKNSSAKSIANILSNNNYQTRDSHSPNNKIYEFTAMVANESIEMVMTSTTGHIKKYKFQGNPKFIECFHAPVIKDCPPNKDHNNTESIKKTLQSEISSCDGLIIWTDCDREGENIGYEIIEVCREATKAQLNIYRARFSQMSNDDLSKALQMALQNFVQPDENVSNAVNVRAELDLRIGAAFTQLQNSKLKKEFPQQLAKLSSITFGRHQMPVLGFIIKRYQEIEMFSPKTFWTITMKHRVNGITIEYKWKRGQCANKSICQAILDLCQEKRIATVTKVERKSVTKQRPSALSTADLLIIVSRELGINATDTMEVLQKLYLKGYISYPRTEANTFSPTLYLVPFVQEQRRHSEWGAFAQRILNRGGPNPQYTESTDQGQPIYPLKGTTYLTHNERKIYEFIVRHFLASISTDALGYETSVNLDIAGETFTTKFLQFSERNYLDIYKYENVNEKYVSNYEEGDTFVPSELDLVERETKSPEFLKESDLLTLMVKHGVGSKSTFDKLLKSIQSSSFVSSSFVPEPLAVGLIEGYNKIKLEMPLTQPQPEFEEDLKQICEKSKRAKDVKQKYIKNYETAFEVVEKNFEIVIQSLRNRLKEQPQQFQIDSDTIRDNTKSPFKCPKCEKDMILRNQENGNKMFTCNQYPKCKNPVWLPSWIENIEILDENCVVCGPNYRQLKVTFALNPFADGSNPRILCVGGCDLAVIETLNINLDSIRNNQNASSSNYEKSIEVAAAPSAIEDVKCSCKLSAKLRVSGKERSKGQKFYNCPKGLCKFFKWENQIVKTDNEETEVENKRKAENECSTSARKQNKNN